MSDRIVIAEKFAMFRDVASPKIVAELNGQHVKLVRFRGRLLARGTYAWDALAGA